MGDVVLRELIMGAQDYDAMREGESQRAPQSAIRRPPPSTS